MTVPPTSSTSSTRVSPRILIVRPTALGDVARTVPALVTLRHAFPNASIDWLVHEGFADVIRHHPALDAIVPFPRKRFGQMLTSPSTAAEFRRWARSLRQAKYDIAVDLQGLIRSGFFTWLTFAKQRIGYSNARELAWLGYNRRYKIDRQMHAVDRMLALLAAAGYPPVHDMRLYVGDADARWLDQLFASDARLKGGYFAVAPTARWLSKCWPIDRYTEIVKRLLADGRAGHAAVILAAPSERSQVQPILDTLGKDAPIIIPTTTVGQLAALLSRASLLIANDSAPLHIAVGFDRPTIAVFGPTDPALVGPYRRDEWVVRPPGIGDLTLSHYRKNRTDQTLIRQVTVDAVWDRTAALLAKSVAQT